MLSTHLPLEAELEEWTKTIAGLAGADACMSQLREALLRGKGEENNGGGGLDQALLACNTCWNAIHAENWKNVRVGWREAYSIGCMVQAAGFVTNDTVGAKRARENEDQGLGAALKALDMALLVGGPSARPRVQRMIRAIEEAGTQDSVHVSVEDQVPLAPSSRPTRCSGWTPPHLAVRPQAIQRRNALSVWKFQEEHMDKDVPVVITGAVDDWPALEKWRDLGYLKRVAGARTVPVEVGADYTREHWAQNLMRISDFIDMYIPGATSKVADRRVAGKEDDEGGIGYLAQHDLFDQVPALLGDIMTPDYTSISRTGEDSESGDVIRNAWFGPGGTVSPLHHDPYHNIFVQVVGTKYIRLYSPAESHKLYAKQGRDHNTSQVDLDNVDDDAYPLFGGAACHDVTLAAGECLFIPRGWWHYVRSLEVSFSVSFWWT